MMDIEQVLDGHDCHLSPEDSCVCTEVRMRHTVKNIGSKTEPPRYIVDVWPESPEMLELAYKTVFGKEHIDSVDCECTTCIHAYDESTDLENEAMDNSTDLEVN